MLDLCEQVFARNGIRSLRYDGGMGREAREYCLKEFRRPGGPKVVLVRYALCPMSCLSTVPPALLIPMPSQHQVWWRWPQPRVCQPGHQVRRPRLSS